MLELKAYLLLLVGILNLGMGFIVLVRNPKLLRNILFFLLSLSISGWVFGIAGFLLTTDRSLAFFWAKVYYAFPLFIAATLPLFTYTFPVSEKVPLWVRRLTIIGLVATLLPLLTIKTFVTEQVIYHSWGKEIVLNKTHYLLYSVYLVGLLSVGLFHIFSKSRKLTLGLKKQARTFFSGFVVTTLLGTLFNLVLPWFGNYRLIWLGPLFTSALVFAIGYSIVKYKLFDIRFFVLRAIAYLATLLVIAVLYIAPGTYIMAVGIMGYPFNPIKFSIGVLFATVVALYFRNLKEWFDTYTNRIFFRDSYDPAALLARLNEVLVSNVDLEAMLTKSSRFIATAFKADYSTFAVKTSETDDYRYISSNPTFKKTRQVNIAMHKVVSCEDKMIVTDYLSESEHELQSALTKNNVALAVKLYGGPEKAEQGFLLLGYKKSGNSFDSKDVRTLEAMANALTIAIQNALRFEEIKNFNITLQQRVDDATAQLRRTNAKLKALDETKDDFISMASHQLRTPLTAVKGYLSMVLEGDAGTVTPIQRKMINQAFVSSQRMVFLIADLLNVSRLKTGKFVIERTPVNLAQMISEEIGQLQEEAATHSLELSYDKPADFPTLLLDETKSRQVVMNFIDNAVHYTQSGGHIHVELKNKPHTIELRVVDNGIGVPKAEQHHLFTKFYRALNARRERPDGTGLGLFMAKKVIVAQGGAVIFESREGKGSTFGFTMPKDHYLIQPKL